MSTNQPWAPTQGGGGQAVGSGPGEMPGQVGAEPVVPNTVQDLIDENDPRLVSENIDVNVEGDAYATPPPPPDRTYRAKLKLEGVKQEGKDERKDYTTFLSGKEKLPAYRTGISCSIIDPLGKYDGIVVYPQFGGVSTARRRDNTTQVTTILNRIKKPDGTPWAAPGQKMSQLEWITLLVKALATEPEIGIETAWETSCQKCAEVMKPKGEYPSRTLGMHNFPPEQDPAKRKLGLTNSPDLKCATQAGHGTSRARAVVVRFLHLHELPKQELPKQQQQK